jgi:lipopolysaccharide transport system permease protein
MHAAGNEVVLIEAGKSRKSYLRDIWRYRELFYFLAWRDVIVRYKQTFLGISWSVIRPLLTMVIFTIVFGNIAGLPSGSVPYPLLVFAGVLPWQFFSNAVTESSGSIISNSNLVTKVFFPRIIIPFSSVAVALLDFLISFVLLLLMMLWYSYLPGWQLLLFPLFIAVAALFALGSGLWLSAFNVRYRDFRYVIPFIVQLSLFISPVGFSSSVIPGKWRLIYFMNPMAGVIDGFRWSLLGNRELIYIPGFALSLGVVLIIFISGYIYFRNTERVFADII